MISGSEVALFSLSKSQLKNEDKSSYIQIIQKLLSNSNKLLATILVANSFINIAIVILFTIEIIKELPITLIMRPFNFETFATKAYIYASQDLLEAAAAPSLFLIIIASFFILITSKYILKD